MRSIFTVKRQILFLCLFAMIICGCVAPSENKALDRSSATSSGLVHQARRMNMELPAFLDEEEFSGSDDSLSDERVHNRKTGAAGKMFMRLCMFSLLTSLLALFAYLLAGIFHGSSCPTYGLLRTITFIFHSDGRKASSLFS